MRLAADGEILVKTTRGRIAAPLDANGWFRTGDVGHWVAGRLEVADRKGACVKLANGEFLRPQKAEALYVRPRGESADESRRRRGSHVAVPWR